MLHNDGVAGAFVCGTTGEGLLLSLEERREIVERWITVAPDGLKIIIHVAHPVLEKARMLAAHAESTGADAISTVGPVFFPPARIQDLVTWCAAIASAAPQLPFYYYYIPSMIGFEFAMADFLRAVEDRIPTLAGIKFTHYDLADFRECLDYEAGRYDLLAGRDEYLLASLAMGARGAVGSTYNFAAPLYLKMMQALEEGNLAAARKFQSRATAMIRLLIQYGGLPAGKSVMKLRGLDCGPVRLPLRSLSHQTVQDLFEKLAAIGISSETLNEMAAGGVPSSTRAS